MQRYLWFFYLLPQLLLAAINYEVRFTGVCNPEILRALRDHSDLVLLKNRPPASLNGLHYRIQADVPQLLSILHAFSYYDARIEYEINTASPSGWEVILCIQPGIQYRLASYEIYNEDCYHLLSIPCCPLPPISLGLSIDSGVRSQDLLHAENTLLHKLSQCGYPLASIDKRRILVDIEEKNIQAATCVQEGPLAYFGPVTFFGSKDISPKFLDQKITWKEGDVFNSELVDKTQERLLRSDLFSSVLVTYADTLNEHNALPMKIYLSEAKHRRLNIGVFYATVDGPGASISWEHRNVRGMGEQLSLNGVVSQRNISGSVGYRHPDFWMPNQTLYVSGLVNRERITAYFATTYAEINRLEHQVDAHLLYAIGLQEEYITVRHSATNGNYGQISLSFYGKYSTADSPLDPTEGSEFAYSAIPTQSFLDGHIHFFKQRASANFYIPLIPSRRVVVALHAEAGAIGGAKSHNIPLPQLFLGGSEGDLRGYAYRTVSPLNAERQPLGGRSAIFATAELRGRVTQIIGLVGFVDFGTVTKKEWPQVNAKWFKSVGAGVRLFTFFGPLRFDVGFPLDPRPGIDTWGKIYANVGQCF